MDLFTTDLPPFNGDRELADAIAAVIREGAPSYIVETGLWHGATARWFRHMFPLIPYAGIELDPDKYINSVRNVPDADLYWESSPVWLRSSVARLGPRPFLFLDAHGYNDVAGHLVLDDELAVLAEVDDPIIVVHDYPDGTAREFTPGYDKPVLEFLQRRPDMVLYLCSVAHHVGVCLVSRPTQWEGWHL